MYIYIYCIFTKPVHKIAKAKGIRRLSFKRFLTEVGKEKGGEKSPKPKVLLLKKQTFLL